MRVKKDSFNIGRFKIGDGSNTMFWEDIWLDDTSLAQQYSSLYNILQQKNVTIANELSQVPLNIGFRRALTSNKRTACLHL
jgi:hypothetical protein